jgi:hypothetical protein
MDETSNALCVDRVVLPMGADKPDVDDAIGIEANLFTIGLNWLPPAALFA